MLIHLFKIYGKLRVEDTLGNTDFIIKLKSSQEGTVHSFVRKWQLRGLRVNLKLHTWV